jgi:acyl-coenzyme A thioesterase PaaI-like protein
VSPERLVHHELCFGCGRTNLFGLLMDIEQIDEGHVRGRGFVKQDHQGSMRGAAHEGILAAALTEAMSLACGGNARATQLELRLLASVPVGTFVDVVAQVVEDAGQVVRAKATANVEDQAVATATGSYDRG